jgi:hypothetical protein
MTVRKSDLMLLEGWLRKMDRRMNPKLVCLKGQHNTAFDNPVQVQWGSNSFFCPIDELSPLIDAMDDEHTTPSGFLHDTWMPFLREWADR